MGNEKAELEQLSNFLKSVTKASKEITDKNPPKIERPAGFDYENGIKDRSRVVELAEVFTPKWMVEDMLDELPKELFKEPKSRFMEPSCGNGNFLIEILARKFEYIASETPKLKREFAIFTALASTYGIDINEQNILEARKRVWNLLELFLAKYFKEFALDARYQSALNYVIQKNFIIGDTLYGGDNIEILEFTYPGENLVTRRIFTFLELQELNGSMMMFPRPLRVLPTVDFKDVANAI